MKVLIFHDSVVCSMVTGLFAKEKTERALLGFPSILPATELEKFWKIFAKSTDFLFQSILISAVAEVGFILSMEKRTNFILQNLFTMIAKFVCIEKEINLPNFMEAI